MAKRYITYLRLDEIQLADENPKLHDQQGIARSLEEFGLGEVPMLDERTGKLVAGHGRYEQLVRLSADGRRRPDGVEADEDGTWLIPVLGGWKSRSEDQAKAYLVTSNRIGEKGGWDDGGLHRMLSSLAENDYLLVTGYDESDVDNLAALNDDEQWNPPPMRPVPSSDRSRRDEDDDVDRLADEDDEQDHDDSDMWPKIDMRVSPEVFDAWRLLLDAHDGKDDVEKLRGVLVANGLLL